MMKKVLVIEDEPQTREILVESLEAEGFNVISAENGHIGINQVKENLPDLVICDIMMPELDGYGVFTTLRQNPITANIPLIFLTAKASEAEQYYGIEIGANGYLNKPCTVEDLLRVITNVSDLYKKQAVISG
jgi:CheY-like chemotaxis protein